MSRPASSMRFRFAEFVVSPLRRTITRDGREIRLIPRYFDLLLLLIERRGQAVSRRDMFDEVWADVVVSDGALSQAIRTLRRALGDDSRGQVFIRTVPRHGYRFVYEPVVAETDEPDADAATPPAANDLDSALADLLAPVGDLEVEDRRAAAAETIHGLDLAEALKRLGGHPRAAAARALLRDTRWEVPHAGRVPILAGPEPGRVTLALVRLRLSRALRLVGLRWAAAAAGGAAAGAVAGLVGAVVLRFGPGSSAGNAVLAALPLFGAAVGGLGAAGVGAGLAAAETIFRSWRIVALTAGGALGGGFVGATTHAAAALVFESLFGNGLDPVAGGIEGLALGGVAGLGYGAATYRVAGGMAAPRGGRRLRAALIAAVGCAGAAVVLALAGRHLGAMSLDFMAGMFPGSQVGLDPLARLLGEAAPGRVTAGVIGAWEGAFFGFGLVFGMTRRPR